MSDSDRRPAAGRWDKAVVWAAQGFGSGRFPRGPGTAGSFAGLLWAWLLLVPGSPWFFGLGAVAGVCASVWLCGKAEQIMAEADPPSVVIDEITAMPLCFLGVIAAFYQRAGRMPVMDDWLTGFGLLIIGAVFLAFRVFDILKPPPLWQSQHLPGGWGVTTDDVLAAVYVNAVAGIVIAARAWL